MKPTPLTRSPIVAALLREHLLRILRTAGQYKIHLLFGDNLCGL